MYQKFLFAKIEATDLHRQFVKRFAAQLTTGEFRSVSDDSAALSRGDYTEFDDFTSAIASEQKRGGWQAAVKTNVETKEDAQNLERHANKIGRFVFGWEDGEWLTANGYTISDEVDTIRANRIAEREADEPVYLDV